VAALQKNSALLDGFRAIYVGVLFLNLSRYTHPTVRRKAFCCRATARIFSRVNLGSAQALNVGWVKRG
jgi:hypothetical protein